MASQAPIDRIYRLKVVIVALSSLMAGVSLLFIARVADGRSGWEWLAFWPISEIGGTLTAAGLFGIAWDYIDARDKEEREDERIRRLLKEAAPDFRDAVIAGFAETPESLRGVATNATLDHLATNSLGLRLGDQKFASEIYAGLLAQAIRTPERWEDVDVSVRLSCIQERSTDGAPRKIGPSPLFDVVVTWEYTVTPSKQIQRFAATSSLDEFREYLDDIPGTSTWYLSPESGVDARERSAFEVLAFSIDGVDQPMRRSVRRNGQTYSIDLGHELIATATPVRIRQVYRTVSRRAGHRFRLALTQPTHGLRVLLDYSATDIAELRVGDLVSGAVPTQVKYLPKEAPAKQVEVSAPGWILPQAEVSFVWTLSSETDGAAAPRRSRAA